MTNALETTWDGKLSEIIERNVIWWAWLSFSGIEWAGQALEGRKIRHYTFPFNESWNNLVKLKLAHALMGHRRDPFQRRKFSISIALKTSFYSWPVHWSGFCSKRRFCGRNSLARERDLPAGQTSAGGEESIDSQFPHVKSVRKKEGKLRGKLFEWWKNFGRDEREPRASGERGKSSKRQLEL